jgi:hypothetical protein
MYPHERALTRTLADKPFAIIGVNSDKDLDKLNEVCEEKHITWRSFWNGEEGTQGPISKKWQVTGWPTTYLIDQNGIIRYKNVRGEALDEAIETLLAEMDIAVDLTGIDHEAEDAKALAGDSEEEREDAEDDGEDEANAKDKPESKDAAVEKKDDDKAADSKKASAEKADSEPADKTGDEANDGGKADSDEESQPAADAEPEDEKEPAKEAESESKDDSDEKS